ncbi:unnamed protein product [Effrenium voratum]|nr:unnamed protein product [Effrenium voratum]
MELLHRCLGFCGAAEAGAAEGACRAWRDGESGEREALWRELCRRCWATKVGFRCTEQLRGRTWKENYRHFLEDGQRQQITREELTGLVWDFTFRLHPERRASSCFRFEECGQVANHPNGLTYEWSLSDDGRHVALGQFPQARVTRRRDWGWAIANGNIICCSLEAEDLEVAASELHPELFNLEQLPSLQLVQLLMRLQVPR